MLIELGVDRAVEPVAGPGWRLQRSRLLAAAALAAVLQGDGALPPGPPPLAGPALVPVGSLTTFRLTGSLLFVGAADQSVAAYPVPRSAFGSPGTGPPPRWRVRLPGWSDTLRWVSDAGVLLATIYPGPPGGSGPRPDRAPQLVALDGATGRTLWTDGPAAVLDTPPGGYGLLQVLRVGVPNQLRWTDLRTGRVAWSRPLPLGTQADLAGPGRVLLTDPSGGALLLDEATGTVLAGGELGSLGGNPLLFSGPAGGPPDPFAGRLRLVVLRGEVLVQHVSGRTGTPGVTGSLTAFDLPSLGRMWSVRGALAGDPVGCAPLVCLGGIDGTVAVDPVTGAVRWRTPDWRASTELPAPEPSGASPPGASLPAAEPPGASPSTGPSTGRVLAASGSAPARTALLDVATGRVAAEFPGAWRVLGTIGQPRPEILLVSPVDDHRSAVAALRPDVPSRPRVIGQISDVDGRGCQAAGEVLACPGGQLRLWWLR